MAVVSVTTVQIKPDRMEDYIENARQSKAALEKNGFKNVRLLTAVVAGEATGALVFVMEADDAVAHATLMQQVMADPEMPHTLNTPASAVASYQNALWMDIPL